MSITAAFLTTERIGCAQYRYQSIPLHRAILSVSQCNLLKRVIDKDAIIYKTDIKQLFHIADITDYPPDDTNVMFMQRYLGKNVKREHFATQKLDFIELDQCLYCLARLHAWFENRDALAMQYAIASYVIECYRRYSGVPPIPTCLHLFFTINRSASIMSAFFYSHVFANNTFCDESKKAIFLLCCRGKSFRSEHVVSLPDNFISIDDATRPRGKKAAQWHDMEMFENVFEMMILYSFYFNATYSCTPSEERRGKRRKMDEDSEEKRYFTLKEHYCEFAKWANIEEKSVKESFCVKLLWRICTYNGNAEDSPPPCVYVSKK